MDDIISRQFLIEAFKEEFYEMYSDDFNYMIKWFENLPSANRFEYFDKLWKIAYERGKRDVQQSVVTMKLDVDKESLRKAMEESELTLVAEPRRGKWKTEYDTHTKMLACSACGGRVIYSAYTSAVGTKGYAYCPYCGARMEE